MTGLRRCAVVCFAQPKRCLCTWYIMFKQLCNFETQWGNNQAELSQLFSGRLMIPGRACGTSDKLLHHIPSAARLWLPWVPVSLCGASLLRSVASSFIHRQHLQRSLPDPQISAQSYFNIVFPGLNYDWQKIWWFFWEVKADMLHFHDVDAKHYCCHSHKSLYVTYRMDAHLLRFIWPGLRSQTKIMSFELFHFIHIQELRRVSMSFLADNVNSINTLTTKEINSFVMSMVALYLYHPLQKQIPSGSISTVHTMVYLCIIKGAPLKWVYVCQSF